MFVQLASRMNRRMANWCGVAGLALVLPMMLWFAIAQAIFGKVYVGFMGKYADKVLFAIFGVGAAFCFAAARNASRAWHFPFIVFVLCALTLVLAPRMY